MTDSISDCRNAMKELLQTEIKGLRTELTVRMDAADKAVDAAASKLDVRLDHANNTVGQMMEFQREMRSGMVQSVELQAVVDRLVRVEMQQAKSLGQSKGHEPLLSVVLIVVAAVVAAVVSSRV